MYFSISSKFNWLLFKIKTNDKRMQEFLRDLRRWLHVDSTDS